MWRQGAAVRDSRGDAATGVVGLDEINEGFATAAIPVVCSRRASDVCT